MGNIILRALGNLFSIFKERPPAPPPQIVEKAAPILKEPPQVIIQKARKLMGVDCVNYYNFVVSGQSGVGKSSFINGVLSLKENDACLVGEVETTQQIRCYSNKDFPTLKIWDIPGAGTKAHPASSYFKDKHLYAFDAILILSSDRFLEVDFDILKSAGEFATPCALVRTKCDVALESRAKRDQVNAFEASQRLREDVARSFRDGLHKAGLSCSSSGPLFFISNRYFDEGQDAYSIYDKKTRSEDTSLPYMDEELLKAFVLEAADRRRKSRKGTRY